MARDKPRKEFNRDFFELSADRKSDAIVEAAIPLFARHGYHDTSLEQIAEQLNVTKPTLYYNVGNKDALFNLCHITSISRLIAKISDATRPGMSGSERLDVALTMLSDWVTTDEARCFATRVAANQSTPGLERVREGEKAVNLIVRGAIEQGGRDGTLRMVDATMATAAIMGAFSWAAFWFEPDKASNGRQRLKEAFGDLMRNGLMPQ